MKHTGASTLLSIVLSILLWVLSSNREESQKTKRNVHTSYSFRAKGPRMELLGEVMDAVNEGVNYY